MFNPAKRSAAASDPATLRQRIGALLKQIEKDRDNEAALLQMAHAYAQLWIQGHEPEDTINMLLYLEKAIDLEDGSHAAKVMELMSNIAKHAQASGHNQAVAKLREFNSRLSTKLQKLHATRQPAAPPTEEIAPIAPPEIPAEPENAEWDPEPSAPSVPSSDDDFVIESVADDDDEPQTPAAIPMPEINIDELYQTSIDDMVQPARTSAPEASVEPTAAREYEPPSPAPIPEPSIEIDAEKELEPPEAFGIEMPEIPMPEIDIDALHKMALREAEAAEASEKETPRDATPPPASAQAADDLIIESVEEAPTASPFDLYIESVPEDFEPDLPPSADPLIEFVDEDARTEFETSVASMDEGDFGSQHVGVARAAQQREIKQMIEEGQIHEVLHTYAHLSDAALQRMIIERLVKHISDFTIAPILALGAMTTDKQMFRHLMRLILAGDRTAICEQINLNAYSADLRKVAIVVLSDLGLRSALPKLKKALEIDDVVVRSVALHGIAKAGPAAAAYIPTLVDTARGDPDSNVRIAAAKALKTVNTQEAYDAFARQAEETAFDLPVAEVLDEMALKFGRKGKKGLFGKSQGPVPPGAGNTVPKKNYSQLIQLAVLLGIIALVLFLAKNQIISYFR